MTGGSSISSYSSRNSNRSIKQMRAMNNVALSCRKLAEKMDENDSNKNSNKNSKNDNDEEEDGELNKSDENKLKDKEESSSFRGLHHFFNDEENNIDEKTAQDDQDHGGDPIAAEGIEKSPEKRPSVSWGDNNTIRWNDGLNNNNRAAGNDDGE